MTTPKPRTITRLFCLLAGFTAAMVSVGLLAQSSWTPGIVSGLFACVFLMASFEVGKP